MRMDFRQRIAKPIDPIKSFSIAQVTGSKNILMHSVPSHGQKLIQVRRREEIGSYSAVVGYHNEVSI